MGPGKDRPPTAASPIAIRNDRYTSIRDIQSVATNVRNGSDFVLALARPAPDDTNAYYAAEVQSVLRPKSG